MKYDIQSYVLKLDREYHKRIKWYRLLAVLSCITVFLTIYLLIMPGITKTDEYYGDFESSDLSRFGYRYARCEFYLHCIGNSSFR